jgi:hypothetical protein
MIAGQRGVDEALRLPDAHEDASNELWTETASVREHPIDERANGRHEAPA